MKEKKYRDGRLMSFVNKEREEGKMKGRAEWLLCLIVLIIGILLFTGSGSAADKSLFNRQVIEIIVCTKVGGGYDTDARLIAPFLQKELPGSTVIVRNVPGGGHIVGANRVWGAKPNGLSIGVANVPGLIAAQIRKEEGMQFDLRKFTWLGRLYSRHRFLFGRKSAGFDTANALMKDNKDFKIGCSGVGDGPYNTGLLTAEALGLKKVRLIPNYGGSEEPMGILRKEIEGAVGGLESWQEMIDQGEVAPLLTYDAKRYSGQPNVPALSELVKTESGKAIAAYVATESELSRAIFTAPNTPKHITQVLTAALMKALQREDFKKTVAQMKREPFNPLPGDDVAKKVTETLSMPLEIAKLIIKVSQSR
jgi:tripartite-type tricarboxylate transporter receptor subunit TctC